MTKTKVNYTLQAFDEMLDIITEQLEQYWTNKEMWDSLNIARMHVIDARATYSAVTSKLLLATD